MDFISRASDIYSSNVSEFQKACGLYKRMLDRNFGGKFCLGDHCRTIFMVEVDMGDGKWGATPKTFQTERQADQEIERLKAAYPFISNLRIVTRKIEDAGKEGGL